MNSDEIEITFDQDRFHKEKDAVDWGILISEHQGGATVCIVALDKGQAIKLLADTVASLMVHI